MANLFWKTHFSFKDKISNFIENFHQIAKICDQKKTSLIFMTNFFHINVSLHIYLQKKVVFFVLYCDTKISQTMPIRVHTVLLVSLESSWWVRVHWLDLRFLGATMWKLLIIEPFFQWTLNKIGTKNCIEIWKVSWCCWKALEESNLIKFISQIFEPKCARYWFLSGFCCLKFK